MKKVLVIIAILGAAAACGGASSTSGGGSTTSLSAGPAQSSGSFGAPTKISAQPGSVGTANPPLSDVVPAIQGPQVIPQAELKFNVTSGLFDSNVAAFPALVHLKQGFISGTDAQASPAKPNDQS